MKRDISLGLIGAGAFGEFCLESFSKIPGVRIVAVADVYEKAAQTVASRFGATAYTDPAEMIAAGRVDLIHIATPPSSHYSLVLEALKAGKNCLCEKPLALSTAQADEMLAAASNGGLIVPVNFVLRHNAVTEAVKAVLDSGAMGKVLSARLTNCAGDTKLGADHWFWDKSISGGIFIEHGVHFFDLYRYWFGPGCVLSAHTETREGTGQEDRVTCEIRHESGVVASHYHGFDQMSLLDRTDHRLVCEMGDIRVEGWIPLTLRIDAAVDEQAAERLASCLPGAAVTVLERYDSSRGEVSGRGVERNVSRRVLLEYTPNADKQAVYAAGVAGLLSDQIAYLKDRTHRRRVGEQNGRDALALAETAAKLAER